uniref:tRNA-dihydrouridine synthase n=1 Tax=Arcella intermedia TaxID=1963864 RepID=A0A6B2L8C9_9EUKA
MVSAPLANVTDCAFRFMLAKYGKPDVMWTEFVSVDGLLHSPASFEKQKVLLRFSPIEHPIVVQLFGKDPQKFYDAIPVVKSFGFDGVDINMGCPDKVICKNGGGAALIKDMKLAQEIIKKCKMAAGDDFPVSVKTRIGYDQVEIEEWMEHLLDVEPAVLSVHLRTKKEMSAVPAKWDQQVIGKIVDMRRKAGSSTLIIGNGDVASIDEAQQKISTFGIDGVMVGRGFFGTPWFFSGGTPEEDKIVEIVQEHIQIWEQSLGQIGVPFHFMRKHFKSYLSHIPGSSSFRHQLMLSKTAQEANSILEELKQFIHNGKIKGNNHNSLNSLDSHNTHGATDTYDDIVQ